MKFKTHQPDTSTGEKYRATLHLGDDCCVGVTAHASGRIYVSTGHAHGSQTVTLPTGGAVVLGMLLQQAAGSLKAEG